MDFDISDERLVRRAKEGDHDAFEQLFNKYNKPICQFINHLVRGRPQETQDIAQDTFVKAWKSLSTLKQESCIRPWLYSIARNCTQDYLRRMIVIDPPISLEETKLDPLDSNPAFEAQVEIAILFEEALKRALERIRPEIKECWLRYYHKNAEPRQIAEELGLKESTVTTYLRQARRGFLEIFEEVLHERSSKQRSKEGDQCNE